MNTPRHSGWLLVGLVIVCLSGVASAQQRVFVGARNLGMGNTGVGASSDGLAVHYNPAGMAFGHSWELQFPLVTADAQLGGDLFRQIDELSDVFETSSLSEIQQRFDSGTGTPEDLVTALDAFLYELPDIDIASDGATLRGISGPAVRWKNWGVSMSIIGTGGIDATVDLSGVSLSTLGFDGAIPNPTPNACMGDQACLDLASELIAASGGQLDQDRAETLVSAAGPALQSDPRAQEILTRIVEATANGEGTLANNQSGALTSTFAAAQLAFSYSHLVYRDQLSVGGNLRLIRGETSIRGVIVAELQDAETVFEDVLDDLTTETKTSTDFALDLAVMYRPWKNWSFGVVGNNLNAPSFDFNTNRPPFELEPLWRVGAAYRPLKWFNVALDYDLNEIDSSVVRDLGYQYVNLGTEFLVGRWFSGWLGAYDNLAVDSANLVYTGGVGFAIGRFQIALAAAVASDRVDLNTGGDSSSFPSGAGVSFSLNWGPKRQQP